MFFLRRSTNRFIPSTTSTIRLNSVTPSINEFLRLHNIVVKGTNEEFLPMISFEETPFTATMIESLYSEGFTSPTPIQAQSWPIALAGKDLISVARTGSGKTCAFLLPGFMKIVKSTMETQSHRGRVRKTPQMLVIAPTRELTQQISDEAHKFIKHSPLSIATLYGGTPKGSQFRQLSRGVDIVIGTPGRCNDLIADGALDLSQVTYLVLDEADRMLDMGFEPQIRTILNQCHPKKQNLFFTATWPKEIANLALDYLHKPVNVHMGNSDTLNANKAIQQTVYVMKEFQKSYRLEELLDSITPQDSSLNTSQRRRACPKTLVFISRKLECDDLAYELRDMGYLVGSLHGDKDQNARTQILEKYRQGEIKVLVATDVAARGLDIKDIEVVINYDFPLGKGNAVEDYVHRIGRTARGERTGRAFTFLTQENINAAIPLVELLERSGQPVPDDLRSLAETKRRLSAPPPKKSNNNNNNNSRSNSRPNPSQQQFDPISSGGGSKRNSGSFGAGGRRGGGGFEDKDFDEDRSFGRGGDRAGGDRRGGERSGGGSKMKEINYDLDSDSDFIFKKRQ